MPEVDTKDIALIRAARTSGSQEAFTLLVRAYKDFVFRIAFGILRNKMDAEDIAQETFLKAYFQLNNLQEDRAFPSWIATIATRLALTLIKKKKQTDLASIDVEEIRSEQQDMQGVESRMLLDQALSDLGPDHRAVLVLREVQGFDYQEIADILNVPIGTVRSRLHAARTQMRKRLQQSQGGIDDGM